MDNQDNTERDRLIVGTRSSQLHRSNTSSLTDRSELRISHSCFSGTELWEYFYSRRRSALYHLRTYLEYRARLDNPRELCFCTFYIFENYPYLSRSEINHFPYPGEVSLDIATRSKTTEEYRVDVEADRAFTDLNTMMALLQLADEQVSADKPHILNKAAIARYVCNPPQRQKCAHRP